MNCYMYQGPEQRRALLTILRDKRLEIILGATLYQAHKMQFKSDISALYYKVTGQYISDKIPKNILIYKTNNAIKSARALYLRGYYAR